MAQDDTYREEDSEIDKKKVQNSEEVQRTLNESDASSSTDSIEP